MAIVTPWPSFLVRLRAANHDPQAVVRLFQGRTHPGRRAPSCGNAPQPEQQQRLVPAGLDAVQGSPGHVPRHLSDRGRLACGCGVDSTANTRSVAFTPSALVRSWSAGLCAMGDGGARRPIMDCLRPASTSAARNAATVSGDGQSSDARPAHPLKRHRSPRGRHGVPLGFCPRRFQHLVGPHLLCITRVIRFKEICVSAG